MKRLLIMLVILGCANVAHAITPCISNVSGTVATGQTLTITGNYMMDEDKTNWVSMFKTGTAYGFEGSPSTDGYRNMGNQQGSYVTSPVLAGSNSMKYSLTNGANDGGSFNFSTGSSMDYWVRTYVMWTGNGVWPGGHLKMLGFAPGSGSMTYFQPGCSTNQSAPKEWYSVTGNASGSNVESTPMTNPSSLQYNRWYLVEEHVQGNYVDAWVDGNHFISHAVSPTNAGGYSYLALGIINASTISGVTLSNYFDLLTISTSRVYASSLVEISGDGGTTWKYQPPTSLSDSSIRISAELPTLTAANYLLRVTNNRQERSSTYNLSTGEGGGACGGVDTTPPTTTVSPSAGAYSSSQTISLPCSDNVACANTQYCWGSSCTPSTPYSSPIAIQANTLRYYSTDTTNNNETVKSAVYTITTSSDTTPPVVSGGTPSGTLPSGTTTTTLSVATNEASTCKYSSTPGVAYAAMTNTFTITGGTAHSLTASGLADGTTYNRYVRCMDSSGNADTTDYAVNYSVSSATVSGTTLFQEHFDDSNFAARGWYDNTNHGTIVSGGQSGNSLQWAWSSGAAAPTNGGSMRIKFTPTDSLYLSYYVKFQTGWRGSQQTYHPHMLYILSDLDDVYSPLANNYLNTYVEFLSDVGSPYTIRPQIAIQDEKRSNTSNGTPPNNLTAVTENRSVAYCNTPVSAGATGTCYADATYYSANTWKASTASVSSNAWHHVEIYFKMNSISGGKGQSDGIMQEWIDGTQVINHSDVLYRTNQDATKKWAQFVLAPWIGVGSPIAQAMWIDELTVRTSPPSIDTSISAPVGAKVKSVTP